MPKKKTLLGGAAIALAMALVGVGVWAAFTDTATTNVAVDTGQLDVEGAGAISATDIAPGDHIFREITVDLPDATNDGDLVASIDVTSDLNSETLPNGGSLYSGDDGLQVTLAICDGGTWALPAANTPIAGVDADTDGLDDSVSCTGGTVISQTESALDDLIGTPYSLAAADFGVTATATGTIPDGSSFDLLAQLRLPDAADNTYEDATVDFDFVFDAIQRSGVNQ